MTTITKEEVKAFIEQIESDLANGWEVQIFELKLARIALASLTAEPVLYAAEETLAYANMGEIHLTCLSEPMGDAVIPLYTAPPVPIVPEEIEPDSNNTYDYVDGWNACRAAMLQGAEPVSQTYELPELIEGMEVSIDVSTCDADAGNRYFGTVTEVSELDTAKNGYILLVQDAEPNFKTAGNSPVIPDGWISCSERMPIIGELNWRTSFPLLITCEIGVIPAYYGFVRVNGNKHYGFMESLKYGDDSGNHPQTNEYDLISNVTHWMPLPEPPQEVNRG
ncbi:DUF551 domain-containing protein [Salmonella enterica subsp. enterica serovar Oranienburg]|nr:DUF551 domain-containing protein [Salmonella enterica]EBV8417193.1 DUF551 domain-containing protein [Salmonella enterica subsp. enterica serovar Oranienburg]ECG0108978.1 DUF551 domain-containing protein [Salmonella enterica]EDR7524274.1 DUF551 domain-containing protein [Salmonella enterica subsp. enterica serovar Oranienburg]EDW3806171.1 DUF551 domain-containing protein [Salmonella enterica subsp. enterica serovar Oranienburg]